MHQEEGTINLMGIYCKFSASQCRLLSRGGGDSLRWKKLWHALGRTAALKITHNKRYCLSKRYSLEKKKEKAAAS